MNTNPASATKQAQRDLGRRLRELREDADLTARQLAAATGQHYTRVSKIENGVQRPTVQDIRVWCRACGADPQVAELVATLRSIETAYWDFRRQSRAGMKQIVGGPTPQRFAQTSVFRIYEHSAIPGLFQTAGYATAIMEFWAAFLNTPPDTAEAVAVRQEQQQVLDRLDKRFIVVLEEQVLYTCASTPDVHAGQLGRLIEIMSRPNITLGIVPLRAERNGVIISAAFWAFDDRLVMLDTPAAAVQITGPHEIALYASMFDRLARLAVYGHHARGLIARAIDGLGREQNDPAAPPTP